MRVIGLVCLFAAGCITIDDELELSDEPQAVAVTWTGAAGVAVTGNSLAKTAAVGWGNAGARSTLQITGDAFVEFTSAERNRGKSAGLSVGDSNLDYTDIDFSIHLSGNGTFYVIEAGAVAAQFGAYAPGDVFRVQSLEREIAYQRNGATFYTSARVPAYPLLVDAALFHPGATLSNVQVGDLRFARAAGLTASAGTLVKSAADGWGNAGASSVRLIKADDGFVQFGTTDNIRLKIAGLSNVDPDLSNTSVGWGIELSANGRVSVRELGVLRGIFGTYIATDVFRVEVVNNQVRYVKNGLPFFTSTVAPTYPLMFDGALFTSKATIRDVVVEDTFWTAASGVDPIGGTLFATAASGWGTAGAVSIGAITAGAGHVEASTRETSRGKAFGLSNVSEGNSYADIDFAIVLGAGAGVSIYESGVFRGTFGTYTAADVFRVEVNAAGAVVYQRNGVALYTSAIAPTYPLKADAALFSTGATLANVSLVDLP